MGDFDMDQFDTGNDDFGSSGDNDYTAGIPPVRNNKSGHGLNGGKLIILILCAVLAVASAAILLFVQKEPEPEPKPTALASPSGPTEFIAPGIRLLPNELLVMMTEDAGWPELEKILQTMDGIVVSSIPEINQFQVRFNTKDRAALEEKKNALDRAANILRTDYNFLITLEGSENAGTVQSLFPGGGEIVGFLGILPSPDSEETLLFLPSNGFPDRQAMLAAGLDDTTGRKEALSLQNQRNLLYASAFFYDMTPGGELSRSTTTAAIRGQLAALIRNGAGIICIPYSVPSSDHPLLAGETDQMQLLLSSMEKTKDRFLIICTGREGCLIDHTLQNCKAGVNHVLAVLPCRKADPSRIPKDLTGASRTFYEMDDRFASGQFAGIPASDSFQAVTSAAACAAGLLSDDASVAPGNVIQQVLRNGSAVVLGPDGTVAPVLTEASSANGANSAPLPDGARVITLYAEDKLSLLPLNNTDLKIDGMGNYSMPGGMLRILTGSASVRFSISMNGYRTESGSVNSGTHEQHIRLQRNSNNTTGTVSGIVKNSDGSAVKDLSVILTDSATGEIWPARSSASSFHLAVYPGRYDITFSSHDRTPVTLHRVAVDAGVETGVGEILISVPSDIDGTAAGTVRDANHANKPLSGVTLHFYSGLYPGNSVPDGTASVAKTQTKRNGTYEIELPGGMYTMVASLAGYVDSTVSVRSEGERTIPNQDCVLGDSYTFSNLNWVPYDNVPNHDKPSWDGYTEPDEHVVTNGSTIEFYGYNVSKMDQGIRYQFDTSLGFEIECDVDTSTILSHPENGYLQILLGKLEAKLTESGGSILLNGQRIADVSSRFHMILSLSRGGQYKVVIDGKTVANEFISAKTFETIQFGFFHDSHYCDELTRATISNILMRIPGR